MQDNPPLVTVYTTTYCSYCEAAKRELTRVGVPFTTIDLSENPELRTQISRENGNYRTVPMVFLGKDFLGGFAELKALIDQGRLHEKLGLSRST